MESNFDQILIEFNLSGPFEVTKAPFGLINKTFFVRAKEGDFVLQELHRIVGKETCLDAKTVTDFIRAQQDTKTVTDFARSQGISVPEFLASRSGQAWTNYQGTLWRVMKRLPGISMDTINSSNQAYSAGRLTGEFHSALKNFDYRCQGSIPHFHDTRYIFEQFKDIVERPLNMGLASDLGKEIETVLIEVPKQLLPTHLPRQIIHGDLKISNYLFEKENATALLDFDTCISRSPLIDLGDALRSWCNTVGEDNEVASFNKDIYAAARMGYTETASLSEEERELIPQAFRLLVIEQAMRFLKDYFEDNYYAWNPEKFESRRQHNLVRTRGQLSLFEQIAGL